MDVESVSVLLGLLGDLPGVGVDVEVVDRFTKPDRRLFTAEELAYCAIQANPAQSRAGRWCAKEAVSKACAKYLQLTLREIEIRAGPSGRPIVVFPDRANGVGLAAEVSIAHAGGTAIAVAVAVGRQVASSETR
jgi:phosphopantetheine--protein transferase-like protein